MTNNVNLDVNWGNDALAQNDAENKEVLIDDTNNKIYMIKDYIPKRITKKLLKPSYVIISSLILVLIIIIGILSRNINDSISLDNSTNFLENTHNLNYYTEETKSHEAEDEEMTSTTAIDTTYYSVIDTTTRKEDVDFTYTPNVKENDTSTEIILCDENQIWSYELNSQKLTLLYESEHEIKAFEIDSNKTLFLIEENKILSLNKQENRTKLNVNLIFEESRVNPKSIAMDFINNNLYIVDELMGGLIVINTQTKYYSLLLMDLEAPRSIAMDPPKGILFIVTSKSITRANMDGSSLRDIVRQTHIEAITLDKVAEQIYWIQDVEIIMRSDYAGSNIKNVLSDDAPISELTVLGSRLFWLRRTLGLNAKLWSCNVTEDDCKDHSSHYIETLQNMKLVKGVSRLHSTSKYQNSSIRRCDHLSLAMPDGQISCACNMGSQLVYNKSCEPYREFGLYTLNLTIRARLLDTSRKFSVEYIWPTPYRVESLTCKNLIDFDYNVKDDSFYFSDDYNIYEMKIKGQNISQTVMMSSEENHCFSYLVYDWLTANIYYVTQTKHSHDYYIGMLNVKSYIVKTNLVQFSCETDNTSSGCPFGLAISPIRGYLFFSSLHSNVFRIHRYTMSNGEMQEVYETNCDNNYRYQYIDYGRRYSDSFRALFAVDYLYNRLYYITSAKSEIHHVNFNGTDITYMMNDIITSNVRSVSVHKQWIYFNDNENIWKIHKKTGQKIQVIEVKDTQGANLGKFKIVSQPEDNKNPCRNNNGGCEQFCFIGSKPICGCADNYTLTFDEKCTDT